MAGETVVVQGILNADGVLQLPGPVALPPGPGEVTLRAVAAPPGEDLLTLLARIRAEQQACGHVPRTAAEIDADVRRARDEWEEHQLAIEQLQEQCRHGRDDTDPEGPPA